MIFALNLFVCSVQKMERKSKRHGAKITRVVGEEKKKGRGDRCGHKATGWRRRPRPRPTWGRPCREPRGSRRRAHSDRVPSPWGRPSCTARRRLERGARDRRGVNGGAIVETASRNCDDRGARWTEQRKTAEERRFMTHQSKRKLHREEQPCDGRWRSE